MPDSLPSSIAQTQTLPNEFAPVETWIDGLSNGEATILGFILAAVGSFIVWLFSRKKDTAILPINIHPHITVEVPKIELPAAPAEPEASKPKIHLDRLPTVKGEFFGREAELRLLDDAWAGDGTRIIQFIASGGTGKTKLLRHWLDHTDNIDALIAWSFYSQGSSEDKQVSASPFFSHAFDKLGSTRSLSSFTTEEDKGEHLADLLRQQHCVLVLDGLEPLQHAGKGMRGELKDRAIRRLLRSLAGQNSGLCIITTRIAVHELSDRAHVVARDLQNLTLDDGVRLLQSLGVQGNDKEIEKAVREYGCHALALHLLGNELHTYLDDDVRKRDTLTELIGDYDDLERHAFKVMQAYSIWLDGTPELKLLQLLGLFDHPIETEVLQVLWQSQIPDLTANIDEKAWKVAIRDLREKHRLLSMHENWPDLLDCHPLIREYFGKQLREKQPDAWQQAHTRLYEYYKALPQKLYGKELPDTLEQMRPLFNAVAHGCAAELYQTVLDEVYCPRVWRHDAYVVKELGAFSDDLATIAHFFTVPWHTPAAHLTEHYQAYVRGWAGFDLRAMGRLSEALETMPAAADYFVKKRDWVNAAINTANLSELQLLIGDVTAALASSQKGVSYADRSHKKWGRYVTNRATYADALHQAGSVELALKWFQEAEQLQKQNHPEYPYLYTQQGFNYCDLLLAEGRVVEVWERAEHTLERARKEGRKNLLPIALDKLTFGRACLKQGNFSQAIDWLDKAVEGLRAASQNQYLPLGLLARVALYRDARNPNSNFARARQDLQEVYDIAEPSGMRLHLTDYHLEMARLLIAEKENPPRSSFPREGSRGSDLTVILPLEKGDAGGIPVQAHVAMAAKLIEETGYKRRLPELQELQKIIHE